MGPSRSDGTAVDVKIDGQKLQRCDVDAPVERCKTLVLWCTSRLELHANINPTHLLTGSRTSNARGVVYPEGQGPHLLILAPALGYGGRATSSPVPRSDPFGLATARAPSLVV